jgi:hypothetical protein
MVRTGFGTLIIILTPLLTITTATIYIAHMSLCVLTGAWRATELCLRPKNSRAKMISIESSAARTEAILLSCTAVNWNCECNTRI